MSITDPSNLDAARKFQKSLLDCFPERADAILQPVEALANAEMPASVVDLCMEGAFQRTYSNVHKAIDALSAPLLFGCYQTADMQHQLRVSRGRRSKKLGGYLSTLQ